jgi:hypothetical protein
MPIKAEWIEFKIENIRALPSDLVGVYECGYKRGNKVVYIGQGLIRQRLLGHTQKVAFVGVTHFRKRRTEDSIEAEARLMDEYRKSHNGNRPKINTQKPTMKNSSQDYVVLDKIKPLL